MTAALALASGKNTTEAAKDAGCSRRQLYEWRQMPAFQEALDAEMQARWEVLRSQIDSHASQALRGLLVLAEDTATPHEVRHAAFVSLLDRCGMTPAVMAELRLQAAHRSSTQALTPAEARAWLSETEAASDPDDTYGAD